MKAKEYDVLSRAVEDGVAYGVSHAFKHSEHPAIEHIIDQVEQSVLTEICQWFNFDSDGNGDTQGDG